MTKHISVMLNECISSLKIQKNGIYVDLTLGRAGHSAKILASLDTSGMLVAFDKDKKAIQESSVYLYKIAKNFKLVHSDYKNIGDELNKMNINFVDGIVADLGVSSPQIDEASRGFSYNKNARLDMRMDQEQELDAYKIINEYSLIKLIKMFKYNGNVKFASRIAKNITLKRPITNTLELANVARSSLPAAIMRKKNPLKGIFQAIRIEVNDELKSLKQMLKVAVKFLKVGSSLLIITFHSLEDRIVKNFFNLLAEDNTGKLPVIVKKKWITKIYKPKKEEVELNKRSRSAKLRVLTRLEE